MERKQTCIALLLTLIGACASAAGKPPAQAVRAPGRAHELVSCPARAALAARLEAVWKAAPAKIKVIRCIPGRFPRPGWLVFAYVDAYSTGDSPDMPSASELRGIVLAPDAVIAQAPPQPLAPWYRGEDGPMEGSVRLVDFDGDGTDEILEQYEIAHGGSHEETLAVLRVEPPAIRTLLSTDTGHDDTELGGSHPTDWTSQVAVKASPSGRGRELVITTIWSQGKPGRGDLAPGTHVYRLRGGVFAEQAR